jgi:hypothetical protein
MCVLAGVVLAICIAILLALAVWTGYLSFAPSRRDRTARIPNTVVFALLGGTLLSVLALALGDCS